MGLMSEEARKLEQDKIEELTANQDPMGVAATMFGMYAKPFEDAVKALSTGQLRRLVNALVKYPLPEKEFISEHDDALKNAFTIGQNLMEPKFIMMTLAMQEYDNNETQTTNEEGNNDGTQT